MSRLLVTLIALIAANSILADECGVRNPFINVARIIGGRPAADGELPWTVALQRKSEGNSNYFYHCGAAVISDRWIVTAAHCLQGRDLSTFRGVFGTTDLVNHSERKFITSFEKAVLHVEFNGRTYENDIALLKTKETIPSYSSNDAINRICLPKSNQQFSGEAYVSGWGLTDEEGLESDFLNVLRINLYDDSDCQSFYDDKFYPSVMLCAGYVKGSKDTCKGDSGSALEKVIDGKSYVIGIVSFGEGCGRELKPGVFTEVSHYIDWINKTISKKEPEIEIKVNPVKVNKDECGIRREDNLFRIVGGRPAGDDEFPWTVSLIRNSGSHLCGASVLNDRWIVTAAHCLHRRNAKSIKGVFGSTNLVNNSRKAFVATFEQSIIHPNFKYGILENDIALLKTTQKIPSYSENQSINKICLPKFNQKFEGRAYVSGWGLTQEEGESNDFLKVVLIRLYSDEDCKAFYPDRYNSSIMMCAGYSQGGSDSCTGDSGGPLEQVIGNKSYLIGIVSYGDGCARPNYPGVYVEVSKYVDWIRSNIGETETAQLLRNEPVATALFDRPKALNTGKILTTGNKNPKQNKTHCTNVCQRICERL